MRNVFVICLIFVVKVSFSQSDCFFVSKINNLAYFKEDSNKLYSGDCNHYNKKGKLIEQCIFLNGVPRYARGWNNKGVLIDSTYYNDINSYIVNMWYENGKILSRQMYNKDHRDTSIFYFESGIVKSILYSARNKITKVQDFYKDGKIYEELNYQNDTLLNPHFEWDKNGVKYEVVTKEGKKHKIFGRQFWSSTVLSRTKVE